MYLAWTILTRHNFDNFARPLFATLLELYSYMGFAEYAWQSPVMANAG
jgi:hypothetical protein